MGDDLCEISPLHAVGDKARADARQLRPGRGKRSPICRRLYFVAKRQRLGRAGLQKIARRQGANDKTALVGDCKMANAQPVHAGRRRVKESRLRHGCERTAAYRVDFLLPA